MSEENNIVKKGEINEVKPSSKPPVSEQLTPMSHFTVLFQKSFNLFQHGFTKFASLLLLPVLGYILAAIFITISALFVFKEELDVLSVLFGIFIAVFLILSIIFSFIIKTGMHLYIKDFQKNLFLLDILKMAKKKAWGFFLVSFLTGIFTMLWSLLFIIPGIMFAVYYSLSAWVYIYENKTGMNALRRSKELIEGYWWPVFGRYFLIYIVFYFVFFGTNRIVILLFGASMIATIWGFISQIINFFMTPLYVIFSCFIYWDLRKIKGESKLVDKNI